MRCNVEVDDERGYEAARTALLDRLSTWAISSIFDVDDIEELVSDVELALEWKWRYGDGDLVSWRTGDLSEFLLNWCPRKLSISVEDSATIAPSLIVFMTFLDDEGILGARSSPLDSLTGSVVSFAGEFLAAMGDPSKFGMAKSLFAAATSEGIDPTDPEELSSWITRFNELPEEERRRLVPDSAFEGNEVDLRSSVRLPPVALPSDDDVAASKASAPILTTFRDLAQFVGSGIKLTKTGNPTLADTRTLVGLLCTGEEMDPKIGDRTFKTTSASDLPRLSQILSWAKKAGVVRVVHSKLVATRRGLGLSTDLAGSFDRAVDALLEIGPLRSQRIKDGWFAWPQIVDMLDENGIQILIPTYIAQQPIELADIIDIAASMVLDEYEFRISDEEVKARIGRDIEDMMEVFELAGLVECSWTSPIEGTNGRAKGDVEITPAGMATLRRRLEDLGFEMPVAGVHIDSSAEELLLSIDLEDPSAVYGELQAWRNARDPSQAASEMAAAIKAVDEPGLINMGLFVLGEIGVDIAAPHVQELTSIPHVRGFALCWLVGNEKLDKEVLNDASDPRVYVDILTKRLVENGPDGVIEVLEMAGDHERQVEVVSSLWRSSSEATDFVLTVISETHSSKTVAKAARKATFKRRSARI